MTMAAEQQRAVRFFPPADMVANASFNRQLFSKNGDDGVVASSSRQRGWLVGAPVGGGGTAEGFAGSGARWLPKGENLATLAFPTLSLLNSSLLCSTRQLTTDDLNYAHYTLGLAPCTSRIMTIS